jgi:16S rRNA (guanine527-N7)-methyltransferase
MAQLSEPRVLAAARSVVDAMAPELAGTRPDACESLGSYVAALARFGAHTDLVGARTPESLAEIALADALVIARRAASCRSPSWEIGAGGASLSVPLALLVGSLHGRLIEPRQKRATFLRMAIGSLDLAERLTVDQSRVEPASPPEGVAALALGRAVFAPDVWIPMALRVVAPGGAFVALSTSEVEARLSLAPLHVDAYELPFTRARRVATWFERRPA